MLRVEQIKSNKLQQLYRYWLNKCDGEGLPCRQDIEPGEIPDLLPYVYLLDVVDDGRDFRYRLVGTHIVESVGFEFTGQLVSEFMRSHEESKREQSYHRLMETAAAQYSQDNLVQYGREHMVYERIICPLRGDGREASGAIEMIFGGLYFGLLDNAAG